MSASLPQRPPIRPVRRPMPATQPPQTVEQPSLTVQPQQQEQHQQQKQPLQQHDEVTVEKKTKVLKKKKKISKPKSGAQGQEEEVGDEQVDQQEQKFPQPVDPVEALSDQLQAVEVQPEEDPQEEAPVRAVSGIHPDDSSATCVREGGHIYSAAKTFQELGLREELLKALADMKFSRPSKIQAEALPTILDSKRPHFVGQAHHGSGKTATFALAMLNTINPALRVPQGLVVCPTRELAWQVATVIASLGKYLHRELVYAAVQGVPMEEVPYPVVVGTPAQILKRMASRNRLLDYSQVSVLVADEADHMVAREGFGDDVSKLRKRLPRNCQVLLFSATFPEQVNDMVRLLVENPSKITVNRTELSLEPIKQFFLECADSKARLQAVENLFGAMMIGQSIIFVQSIAVGKELFNHLRQANYAVALLHGQLDAAERDRVMDDFRGGHTPVLVATNVLSRGIDVLAVQMVVNFDIPLDYNRQPDPETYIHRIGRSGRFGRRGVAVNLVYDRQSMADLQAIAQYFQKDIKPLDLEKAEEMIRSFFAAQ